MEEGAPCPPPPSGYEDSAQHLQAQASGIVIDEQPSLVNSKNSSREETPSGCHDSSASQVRGVVYNIDPEDTQSDLRQKLICNTHRAVSAP
ncbi:hypothetical protein HPB48_018679 [Haemaphysalis longicornis]|uniref:Uncharacterized protein n=1 Tax=Haemaphysalis longicornis TaxID=44386 RepID=A0A9J6GH46_HAELO|nr:hypothetical protein HPB48_018679 [Haemaphysalis longicornis]